MKIKYFVLLGILWGACTSRTNQTITSENKDIYVLAETPNGVDTLAKLLAGRKYNLKGRNGKISFMKIDKNDFYLPAKYFLEQDGDDIWLVEKGSYVLQGKLPEGAVNKEVFLIERKEDRQDTVNSCLVNRDGTFELKGEGDGKVLYLDLRNRGENIYFYAGAGTYELENRDGFLYVVPRDSNIYQSRVVGQTRKMDENMQAMQELQKALRETQDQKEKEEINERIGELFDKDNELAFETIRKFAGTSLAAVFVRDNIWKLKYEFKNFEQAVGLMESVLVSDVEKQVMKKYQEEKAKQLTGKAPDFKLPDTKGNIVKLSDYKGKYLLVDFWASWCKPCREKAKELKKHYPRLKELGVEVVGISCDKNKDQWLKAIEEDQPLWVQVVIDKEINGSDTADDYKVEFIPTLYLISTEGMILEKNPSVEKIESIVIKL